MQFLSLLTFIMVCRAKEIKVLCYGGPGAGMDNVDIRDQIACMNQGLVEGVTFTSAKSKTLHAADTKGYDVILGPGGAMYDTERAFDAANVRAFVKAGGGYYGTCAGAYAGCLRTQADENGVINPYTGEKVNATGYDEMTGKPIYPSVQGAGLTQGVCKIFRHVGVADFSMTSHAQTMLKQRATVEIDHHNGPAMTCAGSTCEMISKFASSQAKGSGAILVDKYGEGNVILISPHPEHPKDRNCVIVARAAAFAGGAITKEQFTEGLEGW